MIFDFENALVSRVKRLILMRMVRFGGGKEKKLTTVDREPSILTKRVSLRSHRFFDRAAQFFNRRLLLRDI